MPFRIPFIAPYFYQANHHMLETLAKTIGFKNKLFVLVSHAKMMFFVHDTADIKAICVTKASKFVKPEEV